MIVSVEDAVLLTDFKIRAMQRAHEEEDGHIRLNMQEALSMTDIDEIFDLLEKLSDSACVYIIAEYF